MHLRQLWNWLKSFFKPSDDCDCLPIEIPDAQNVIRGIYYEVHVNDRGTLKWQAYDPTQGTDEVSVMRASCMSPSACKQKAKSMERAPRKLYRGLAVLNAGAVRSENMMVTDSRGEFCGHAHISTGVVTNKREPNEPRDPSEVERVKAVAYKLIKLSRFHSDQRPEALDWPEEVLLVPPADESGG
jgi:hypothetical protein